MSAGAYGAVQAGTYNTRALMPEALVNGAAMGRGAAPPGDVEELIAFDRLPGWFDSPAVMSACDIGRQNP